MPISSYSYVPGQPLVDTYVGLPYDELLKAGMVKQQQYDVGKAKSQSLEDEFLKVQALEEDTVRRNQIIQGYKNQLTEKIKESKGDYSKVTPFADELSRNIKYDLTQGPLGAIQRSYGTYQQALKEFNEMKKQGAFLGMDEIAAFNALQKQRELYAQQGGVGEGAEGVYNIFSPGNVGKYYDISDDLSKFAQQWSADQDVSITDTGDYIRKSTNKKVSEQEVYDGVIKLALKDPKYKGQFSDFISYYDAQLGEGKGKEELINYLDQVAKSIAAREGFSQLDATIHDDWRAKQEHADALSKPFNPFTSPVFAGLYGVSTITDDKALSDAKQIKGKEFAQEFLKITNQLGLSEITEEIVLKKIAEKGSLGELVKGFKLDKKMALQLGPNALDKLGYVADQYDGLIQADKEATEYAINHLSKEDKDAYLSTAPKKDTTDPLGFGLKIPIKDQGWLSRKQNAEKKVEDLKDAYLENNSKGFTKNHFATNSVTAYTYDKSGNIVVDQTTTKQLSRGLQEYFKNPANLANVNGYVIRDLGYKYEQSETQVNLYNEIKGIATKDLQISTPTITLAPGINGEREVRVTINGSHYIIPSSNFPVLKQVMDSPVDRINTMLFNAQISRLRTKELVGGLKLHIPLVPDDPKQQGTYQFYNDSDFILEDASGKKLSGQDAFKKLQILVEQGVL